jgi:hypothetical protein
LPLPLTLIRLSILLQDFLQYLHGEERIWKEKTLRKFVRDNITFSAVFPCNFSDYDSAGTQTEPQSKDRLSTIAPFGSTSLTASPEAKVISTQKKKITDENKCKSESTHKGINSKISGNNLQAHHPPLCYKPLGRGCGASQHNCLVSYMLCC